MKNLSIIILLLTLYLAVPSNSDIQTDVTELKIKMN